MRTLRCLYALFFCAGALLPARLARAGCTKDSECKGDRICNKGACENPPAAPQAPPPAAPQAASSRYFVGSVGFHAPDGSSPSTLQQWVRLSLDPAAHTLVTRILSFDSAGQPSQDSSVTWQVDGTHMLIVDSNLGVRGQGELFGPPWRWTRISSHTLLPDGRASDSTQTLDELGTRFDSTIRDPQGLPQWISSAVLRNATAAEFEGAVGAWAMAKAAQAQPPPAPVAPAPAAVPSDSEQTSGGWGQNCTSGNVPCSSGRLLSCQSTLPEEHSMRYRGQCSQHTGSVGWVRCSVFDRQGNETSAFADQCP